MLRNPVIDSYFAGRLILCVRHDSNEVAKR
jgi:hypothetical protein